MRLGQLIALIVFSLGPRVLYAEPHMGNGRIEDAHGDALQAFHDALKAGDARISVFGDSHAALDQYTSILRQRLQSRFGSGGPGVVYPVKPPLLYDHRDVTWTSTGSWEHRWVKAGKRIIEPFAFSGMAAKARKRAGFVVVPRNGYGGIHKARLYYHKNPAGGSLSVQINAGVQQKISTRATKRALGMVELDSGDAALDRFEAIAHGDGPIELFALSLESTRGVIVDNLGIPGAKARYQLSWDQRLFEEGLRSIAPHLVIIQYGTNESGGDLQSIKRYERDVMAVVGRIKKAAPGASCLLIGPSEWPEGKSGAWKTRARTAGINEAQRRVAKSHHCGFFDLFAFHGGPGSMPTLVQKGLALADHVHFTDKGYQLLGEALYQEIL